MSWSVQEIMARVNSLPTWAMLRATKISEGLDGTLKLYPLPAPKSLRLTVEIGEMLVETREEALRGEEPPADLEDGFK
jgi:hypothetical protein